MSYEIIKKYSISAKKSLGQNFLIDTNIIQDISQVILVEGKNILEVGPGYGVLTEKLLSYTPQSLHLVELDKDMVSILEQRKEQGDFKIEGIDFQLHNLDILLFSPSFLNYSVVANIPYYITSPILRRFLYDLEQKPDKMVILMQKDVGDKILGKGKNKSSVLSLMIEKKCFVEEKIFVPKESFSPQPKVESSVLLFQSHEKFSDINDAKFLEYIKKGFLEPRKKLIKNLVKGGFEKKVVVDFFNKKGFSENIRAEDLSIEQWCNLVQEI